MMANNKIANEVFKGGPLFEVKSFVASPTVRIALSISTKAGSQDPISAVSTNDRMYYIGKQNFKKAGSAIKDKIQNRLTIGKMVESAKYGSGISPMSLREIEYQQMLQTMRELRPEPREVSLRGIIDHYVIPGLF